MAERAKQVVQLLWLVHIRNAEKFYWLYKYLTLMDCACYSSIMEVLGEPTETLINCENQRYPKETPASSMGQAASSAKLI